MLFLKKGYFEFFSVRHNPESAAMILVLGFVLNGQIKFHAFRYKGI